MKNHFSLEGIERLLQLYLLIEINLTSNTASALLELTHKLLKIVDFGHKVFLSAMIIIASLFPFYLLKFSSENIKFSIYFRIASDVLLEITFR